MAADRLTASALRSYGAIDHEPNNQENRKVKDGLPKAISLYANVVIPAGKRVSRARDGKRNTFL